MKSPTGTRAPTRERLFTWTTAGVLWATCAAGLSPAAASAQDPSGVHCAAVQLAPAPLGKNPDLNPDGTPVRIGPDRRGKYVPIIMVHGWTGSSTHTDDRKGYFSGFIDRSTNQLSTIRPSRSLIGQLQRIPGAAVFTFDYHDYSARWVDDTRIGPALGTAIDCLFRAFGEEVIVVAHSMGGLATRYALTHRGEHGEDRSGEVSNVITFATPETGSLIASLAAGGLDAAATRNKVADLIRLILAECGKLSTTSLETGTVCDLLPEKARAADSEAGRALRAGSPELATLLPFPAPVPVHALYGDNVFTVPGQGWFRAPWDVTEVSAGDLAVMPDSATAGATSARKASCSYQLNLVRAGTDAIGLVAGFTARSEVGRSIFSLAWPCYHSNLMRTVELTNEAVGLVSDDIGGRTPPDDVIRFDGIGIFDLTMTAADLRARGFTDHGNLYTETDPDCVSYAKPGATVSFSVERKTGRILGIKTGSGRAMTTQVGKIHSGSTLAELRRAFRGYRIEERFDMDFGQGTNGVIVNGGGGAIGFSLDGTSPADFASGRAKVTYLNGVGLPGNAPSNMETGC